jgi:hypothetical protein
MIRYFVQIILAIVFCTLAGCSNTKERDTISFKVSLKAMEDTLKVMNFLLSSYNEVNYYFDEANVLLIGTNEVGKIDSLFLAQIKLKPSKYSNTDLRIFSIILFLKSNEINSCFRHRNLGVIVYNYKPTKDDKFEDVRYIILNDGQLDTNSNMFRNSQYIIDKKDNLILIAPIDKRN